MSRPIRISYLTGELDKAPKALEVTWEELTAQLTTAVRAACTLETCGKSEHGLIVDGKHKGCRHKYIGAWSPAAYPPGLTRAKKNVGAVACLVLDLDHLTDAQVVDVAHKLAPYEYVAHATHSDRAGDRCLRVVIKLDAPVSGADWPRFWTVAVAELGVPADPQTCDASRLYFLPSRPADAEFLATTNTGTALEVAAIMAKAPAPVAAEPLALPNEVSVAGPAELHSAALKLAAEWPARGRHHASLALCGALASHGWPEETVATFVAEVTRLAGGEPELDKRRAQAASSIAKLAAGEHVSGWGTLAQALSSDVIPDVRTRLNMRDAADDALVELFKAPEATTLASAYPVDLSVLDLAPATQTVISTGTTIETCYGSSLREYLGEDDPGDDPDAWLIHGIMPAGVPSVIGGHPKTCKTFLVEHMSICLAAGLDWFDHSVLKRGRVLILAREDSVRETRRRIWRLARGLGLDPRELDGWLRIDSKTPFYFASPEDVARMRRTIESFRPALIPIDSLSRTHIGDENSKKEMSIVTSTWGDLCQEYDVAIAPIHHFTKAGEGTLLQKLRGSGDLGALVRHIIGVEKQTDGTTELSFDGNLHPLPAPFLVRMVDALDEHERKVIRFEDAGSAMIAHFDRIDGEILAFVTSAGHDGVTGQMIERDVTGNNPAIRTRIKELVRLGKLFHPGKRYVLGDVGAGFKAGAR